MLEFKNRNIVSQNFIKNDFKCTAGYYCGLGCQTGTPSSSRDCRDGRGGECPVNHKCVEGSTGPVPCPHGFYQPDKLMDTCINCPPGDKCENGRKDKCPRPAEK